MSAPRPARYFPFVTDGGRYTVQAGLHPLATDFGNGPADHLLFQRDLLAADYLAAKRAAAARATAAGASPTLAVVVDDGCLPTVKRHTLALMRRQLVAEGHFAAADVAHRELPDLVMQLQEDVALVEPRGEGTTVTYLHVALPSGWAPWSKRGRSFAEVHKPVPGAARIDGDALMRRIMREGWRRVRFVWGLQFDDRLDQHPKRGRATRFDERRGLWLRVERQVVVGMPEVDAMLFLIRPFVVPIAEVLADPARGAALVAAIGSMNERELHYKGLRDCRDAVLALLRARASAAAPARD